MSSIIEGYNYDIFISYRQKDNKGDRWVSEFVDSLRTELESTFKEEISVYFDINPHDGLLETHDVDASLKDKLKCLLFIPIISRTYCDPKSFAWEHEFKAFVDQASKDQFGLKIKLPNGNVANRMIPVQIHDLYPEDKSLIEKELGGVLRSIEFIYKEPGVNRPLTAKDNEEKNSNKTNYRNQINKVANAIDEVIHNLKGVRQKSVEGKLLHDYPLSNVEVESKSKELIRTKGVKQKSKKWLLILSLVILFIVGAIAIFKIIKDSKRSNDIANLEKSIAVLPFVNDSPDASNKHFIDGTMETILDNLCKIADFKVVSRTSVEQFRNSTKSIPEIAKKLGVNYILEGSGQKYENNIRVTVQLIDAVNDRHIWSDSYDREWKDFFQLQSEIAWSIVRELKAIITPEEKHRIDKSPTENLEAYSSFLKGRSYVNLGREESLKEGIKCFKNAIQLDSSFAQAYVGLSQCYQFMVRYSFMPRNEGYPEAKKAILKALELDKSLGEAHSTLGLMMVVFDWDFYGPEQEFQEAIKLSPNNSEVYSSYAQYLRWIGKYDQGIIIAKRAIELDPLTPITNVWLAINYLYGGYYNEAIDQMKKITLMDSSYFYAYSHLAFSYTLRGSDKEALQYADKTLSLVGDIKKDPMTTCLVGWVYAKSGRKYTAKELLKQMEALSKQTYIDPIHIAFIYNGLDEKEKAFEYLFKAYEIRSGQIIYLNAFGDSYFKNIRSDPRFKDLLKKIGFKV